MRFPGADGVALLFEQKQFHQIVVTPFTYFLFVLCLFYFILKSHPVVIFASIKYLDPHDYSARSIFGHDGSVIVEHVPPLSWNMFAGVGRSARHTNRASINKSTDIIHGLPRFFGSQEFGNAIQIPPTARETIPTAFSNDGWRLDLADLGEVIFCHEPFSLNICPQTDTNTIEADHCFARSAKLVWMEFFGENLEADIDQAKAKLGLGITLLLASQFLFSR